jgi:hypothetical protein
MTILKKLFLLYLIFMVSGCALFPVEPDEDIVAKIDPSSAQSILQKHCPTCNESGVRLIVCRQRNVCQSRYFLRDTFDL